MRCIKHTLVIGLALPLLLAACAIPASMTPRSEDKSLPPSFAQSSDTTNLAAVRWKEFFTDPFLAELIDTALRRNQELNIMMQEINVAQNEVRSRKGEYLPFVNVQGGAGVERAGKYTRAGAVDESTEIEPGKPIPTPLPNFLIAANVSWEVDIWNKLRRARKSAVLRYLATAEGRNFMITHLIAEIATSYYELMALDNQLEILQRNIEIQQNALEIVKMEKEAAKVTELAVRRFEAEVLKNQSRLFAIRQQITVTENRINFLAGRFPQPVHRSSSAFPAMTPREVREGIPSQLLRNRPDIRQAELELSAAKIDVSVTRANFYPSLNITAAAGFEAFNASYLVTRPESMLYAVAGNLVAPVINRNAIKAAYYNANARQVQAVFRYERTILNAYIEVANQLSNIKNLEQRYALQEQQVQALTQSIDISSRLFKSARADYMEVLLTQRDALESRFELIETRKQQMNALVTVYQALGGGWN